MIQNLAIEPFGLRLVLGGGVRLVSRGDGIQGSTTILIRGAPGTGKTVLGIHLATEVARLLDCDVAYGCVEVLPPELAAVVEGLDIGLKVESTPFEGGAKRPGSPRILAGVLDIGEQGDEQTFLPSSLEDLVTAAATAGSDPRVVVLDSLSDGYNLGTAVPRVLADEICKTAASSGRIFVLLEEAIDNRPSPWCFAADVVLELSVRESPTHEGALLRWMSVTKNRFGPAEPGPHQMVIRSGKGVSIRPSARSYLRRWAPASLFPGREIESASCERWGNFAGKQKLPPFEESTSLVSGSEHATVFKLAAGLGEWSGQAPGTHVLLRIGGKRPAEVTSPISIVEVPLWEPLSSHEDLLARVVETLVKAMKRCSVRRILIGDLRYLRNDPNADEIRRMMTCLVDLARHSSIPVVAYLSFPASLDETTAALADVLLSTDSTIRGQKATVSTRRSSFAEEVPLGQLTVGNLHLLGGHLARG